MLCIFEICEEKTEAVVSAMANGSGCHRQGWGGVGWMAVVTALLMDFAVHLRCRVKQNAICTKLRRHPPPNILDGAVGNYADLFAFFGKSLAPKSQA